MSLLSHEQSKLESFRHQTPGAQEQILSAAIRDPQTSGPLIIAYREAMNQMALNRARTGKRKGNPERRSDPTLRRGLGFAVLADSVTVVGVFALQSDARTFAQAIADQTEKQLRVVPGAYTFTPDAR